MPVIDPSSYVHPQATVIGHVTIGKNCYVGPGAVLRGDRGRIISRTVAMSRNRGVDMFSAKTCTWRQGRTSAMEP